MDRRIVTRRSSSVGRAPRRQPELRTGPGTHTLRIDQPIAAHEDLVGGRRKVRHDVAAALVGDDDADETSGKLARLRDHPDAGLRSIGPDHDPEIGRAHV